MRAPPSPRVARPVMYHRWSRITFLHWRYPPAVVQALLPPSLTVATFDGSAWVGVTPFVMEDVRPPGLPAVPGLSRFPETNLRTYVRDAGGRGGIWFLSLDAGQLAAAVGGRAGYGLPYHWSDMTVRAAGTRLRYGCRRRWPPRGGAARCDAEVETGPPLTEAERDETAHFLTARYRLFSTMAGRLTSAEVEHPDWPLHHAAVVRLDQDLVPAAGLPAPAAAPVVHHSPGVPVRVGMWAWTGRAGSVDPR